MAKSLKPFKREIRTEVQLPAVVEKEEEKSPIIAAQVNTGEEKTLKVLDALESAGYEELAARLRTLQVTEGLGALEPYLARVGLVEKQIDDMLNLGSPLDPATLKQLLGVASASYQARAKALVLPFGQVSPRSLNSGNRSGSSSVKVAFAMPGNAVTPRKKD